jgi:hypothetical protein
VGFGGWGIGWLRRGCAAPADSSSAIYVYRLFHIYIYTYVYIVRVASASPRPVRVRERSPQIWAPFLMTGQVLSQQKSSKNTLKRAFFELFADTGAKERGPNLGASLTRLSRHRSWSRYLVLGALFWAFIAKS